MKREIQKQIKSEFGKAGLAAAKLAEKAASGNEIQELYGTHGVQAALFYKKLAGV